MPASIFLFRLLLYAMSPIRSVQVGVTELGSRMSGILGASALTTGSILRSVFLGGKQQIFTPSFNSIHGISY